MNQLYKLTSMETSFAVNMLAIHDNRPKTLAMMDAINFYIEHRREVVVRRTRYLLGTRRRMPSAWKLSCWPCTTWMTSFPLSGIPKPG